MGGQLLCKSAYILINVTVSVPEASWTLAHTRLKHIKKQSKSKHHNAQKYTSQEDKPLPTFLATLLHHRPDILRNRRT
jgi:hypothetical protein